MLRTPRKFAQKSLMEQSVTMGPNTTSALCFRIIQISKFASNTNGDGVRIHQWLMARLRIMPDAPSIPRSFIEASVTRLI